MTDPLITIGITCYNAAQTVERAINSALLQTWRPIEIVVVDDCSTDHSFEIVEQLAKSHYELRVLQNPRNVGVAATRNRIVEEARGQFLAFFDDDDESLPERVAAQLDRIMVYERDFAGRLPVICHTARRQYYPDGRECIARTMGQNVDCNAPFGLAVAERVLLGTPLVDGYGACPSCSQMGRLDLYRRLGGFDPAFRRSEDTDFTIRLAKTGGHFVGLAHPYVIQTMTKTSDKNLVDEYRYILALMEKHRDVMDRVGQYRFCKRWIAGKQAWLERRYVDFGMVIGSLAIMNPFLTVRRLALALPNIGLNRAFSRFHVQPES